MDALAELLDAKFRTWPPDTAIQVRQLILEIMALADQGTLDILRSRRALLHKKSELDGIIL